MHQSPLTTSLLNYPQGWNLASSEMSPGMVLPALPLAMLGGPTLGYNILALSSFVVAGLTMHCWVFRWTGMFWAGILAGTAFAYSPFRVSHYIAGHLNLLGVAWLPLFFMGLQEILSGSPPRPLRWGLMTAGGLALIGLSSQYLVYMTLVVTGSTIFILWLLALAGVGRFRPHRTAILVFLLAALPAVSVISAPYLAAAVSGELPVRGAHLAEAYSASPSDYFLPASTHPVWGPWIGSRFNKSDLWIEGSLYVGGITGVLAVLAFVPQRPRFGAYASLGLVVAIAIVAFLLSLGPTLHWLSRPVDVSLPSFLNLLQSEDGSSLSMPAQILYAHLPFYSSMRVPMRYGAFVVMSVSFLAGLGMAAWFDSPTTRRRWIVLGVVFGLLVFDIFPPRFGITRVEGRPVDYWLAEQPAAGAVAEFPYEQAASEDQVHIYHTLIHGKPYIGALGGAYETSQQRRIQPILERFPDEESLALLRTLGVSYLVVDVERYSLLGRLSEVEATLERLGVPLLARLDAQMVYGLQG